MASVKLKHNISALLNKDAHNHDVKVKYVPVRFAEPGPEAYAVLQHRGQQIGLVILGKHTWHPHQQTECFVSGNLLLSLDFQSKLLTCF